MRIACILWPALNKVVNNLYIPYMTTYTDDALLNAYMKEAFPEMPLGVEPLGNRIIVQLRKAKTKSKGGIVLVNETRDTEKYNEVVAKVVAIGPLAYKDINTLEPWPEKNWCEIGDLVRVIKYGGDRWSEDIGDEEHISFIVINDREVICKIKDVESAMKMRSFVD